MRIEPVEYRGLIWCVKVPTGAFVARRNGKVFVTGNSGFPKSLDVGKAIDKAAPRAGMFSAFAAHYGERRRAAGLSHAAVCAAVGAHGEVNHGGASVNWERGYGVPTLEHWPFLVDLLGLAESWRPLIERVEAEREVVGSGKSGPAAIAFARENATEFNVTAPATAEAQQWDGWGTALKPSAEFWYLARKPLSGTVAGNVTTWGTGALNIDGCRVGTDTITQHGRGDSTNVSMAGRNYAELAGRSWSGRWPANTVISHNDSCADECSPGCAAAELDRQSGVSGSSSFSLGRSGPGGTFRRDRCSDVDDLRRRATAGEPTPTGRDAAATLKRYLEAPPASAPSNYGDSGGASRFFPTFRYVAKPSTREKGCGLDDRNTHPTVKPVELMRWLIRLVTPPGGTVLDPFAGSGTTLVAATLEGFDSIGVEAEAEYLPLIEGRVRWAERERDPVAPTLFGEVAG